MFFLKCSFSQIQEVDEMVEFFSGGAEPPSIRPAEKTQHQQRQQYSNTPAFSGSQQNFSANFCEIFQENNKFFQQVLLDHISKANAETVSILKDQIRLLQKIVESQNQQITDLSRKLAVTKEKFRNIQ